ncbi:major capsid protein [Microbacterium phage Typher]|nr:major capsid protein [Microbacterium phage Typher]
MATTVASDLIVPEVWGPMVMKAALARAVMVPLATTDTTLEGQPGDTIQWPTYGYIGDAVDTAETDAIVPVKLTTDSSDATIKEATKGVELTDKAVLTAMGNPTQEALRQLGLSTARKFDADLHSSALAALPAGQIVTADELTWDAVTVAIGKFGDEWDPADMAALVVHSDVHGTLLRDPRFQDLASIGSNAVLRGQVGAIGGVPIVVSNRVTKTGTAGAERYRNLFIRKNALLFVRKRAAIIERDRDILRRTTVVTTNAHYGTKRVDDAGIVEINTGAAEPDLVAGA